MSTALNLRHIMIPANQIDLNDNQSYLTFLQNVQALAAAGIVLIDTQLATSGNTFFHLTVASSAANDASIFALIAPLQAALGVGTIYTWENASNFQ